MATEPTRPRPGRVIAGLLLVGLGGLWLVDEFADIDLPWTTLLPVALILVGVALMVGAGSGAHGTLVTLGVFLTLTVIAASAFGVLTDVPLRGGVGERNLAPTVLEAEYRLALGSLTVDLTGSVLSGQTVEMSVGMGELVVIVPEGAVVAVDAAAGLGEVMVFGESQSGISPELKTPIGTETNGLVLIVRVGVGKVEVRTG